MVSLHKTCFMLLGVLSVCPFHLPLYAQSCYPTAVSSRIEGIEQGETNRCFGTAVTTAYEHAFAARGFDVKLSMPYTQLAHALHNVSPQFHALRRISLSPGDQQLINRHGYLLPHYMWPEDLSLVNEKVCQIEMPDSTQMANIPADYRNEMNGKDQGYVFKKGLQNIVTLESIKERLTEGKILTLTLIREIFELFDHKTGLLDQKHWPEIPRLIEDHIFEHIVALAGFDNRYPQTCSIGLSSGE